VTRLFHWEARTGAGEPRQGSLAGESEVEVIAALRGQGLRVTAVRPEAAQAAVDRDAAVRPEVLRLLRELLALRALGRGVPEALTRLAAGRRGDASGLVGELALVRQAVEAGQPLGEALARAPRRFDDLVCRTLAAGEAAGDLDGALRRLVDHAERAARPSPAVAALRRAAGLALALLIALAATLGVLGPAAAGLYARVGVDPGPVSAALAALGPTLGGWLAALALAAAATLGLGTARVHALALRTPGLGPALRVRAAERLARALALALAAPLPLLAALELAAPRVGNAALAAELRRARALVARGVDPATALADARALPPTAVELVREAGAAGDLAAVMPAVAELCAAEAEALAERTGRIGHVLTASLALLLALALAALAWPLRG
jgi:type II secretory pathway component PulF